MTTEPVSAEACNEAAPVARRIPTERTHHGDTFTDDYAWLADKNNQETVAYLEAENAYTEAVTAGQAALRDAIFGEIKARTQETDLSVPTRKGNWWYYARTMAGKQYAVHCRREVRPGDTSPPMTLDGAPLDGEEVLLDGNELAGDGEFFSLGMPAVSPDGGLLAYSTDFAGSERFTVRIKDLTTGTVLPDEIPGTFYGCAWSLDGSALFYITVDDAWRPYRVSRHLVGSPAADDVIVFEEPDERFWVGVGLTRSERFVQISVGSKLPSEVRLLDAARPDGEFSMVLPRRQGMEYSVEHQVGADGSDRLLILHNDNAENFELAVAPLADPADMTPLIAHRADTRLLDVDAFADYLAVHYRRDGLTGVRILRGDGTKIPISLVCRKGTPRDGSAPCLLYGYGSYEISVDPGFSIPRLSLLDRGFSYAIAHIRGGGEMGRRWYDDGKLLRKANTFSDFVACAEHLVSAGWTSPSRLVVRGGSAGGLLMGAVAHLAPQAFGGIVAQVPFVDTLTTILDPSLPLTVTEWEEWGDPLHDPRVYAYIKSYSPYENTGQQVYPPILAITSLNDTRVLYREPAKWIAKLQATAGGGPFLLKTEMVAGHGGRSGRYDAWHEEAFVLAWITSTVRAASS